MRLVLAALTGCSEAIPPLDTGNLDTGSSEPCSAPEVPFLDSEQGFSFCLSDEGVSGYRHNGAGTFPVLSNQPIPDGIQLDYSNGSEWWDFDPGVSATRLDIGGSGSEEWTESDGTWFLIIRDFQFVE